MAYDPHAIVELLVERGNALRAAGVMSLSIGEMSVTLAPPALEVSSAPSSSKPVEHPDALDDPDTFGTDVAPSFDTSDVEPT